MDNIAGIENEIVLHGRRNNQAWFAPTVGVIPSGNAGKHPEIVLSVTQLTGNDIGPCHFLLTSDLGRTWTPPMESQNLFKIPMADDVFESFGGAGGGLGLFYHRHSGTLLGIGLTIFLRDRGGETGFKSEQYITAPNLKRVMAYAVWNARQKDFQPWTKVAFPAQLSGVNIWPQGCNQIHECDDGTILIPAICDELDNRRYSKVTVMRCGFDGSELQYIEHGSMHGFEEDRGLHEPSMICFQGRFFMTIRHKLRSYVTTSKDGLHFKDLETWKFDDGRDLGNYNTQQHWLKHHDRLYLIYNRKSELNNGVFRSRAPLFMAEVDPDQLRVRRGTERIVFPEKGARMGNFCVTDVAANESWIAVGEWLEGRFQHSVQGKRFYVETKTINYIQYIGNLLLARIHWHD